MCQPRHAAQDNHCKNHGAADKQPYGYKPVRGWVLHGGLRVSGSGGDNLHSGQVFLAGGLVNPILKGVIQGACSVVYSVVYPVVYSGDGFSAPQGIGDARRRHKVSPNILY